MIINKLFQKKSNSLTLYFISIIIIITLLISFASLSVYFASTRNIADHSLADTIEYSQSNIVKNLTSFERSLNQTTYQLLNSSSIYSTISNFSIQAEYYKDAKHDLNTLISQYVGLENLFIVNLNNMKVFNKALGDNAENDMSNYVSLEKLLENHKQTLRLFSSGKNSSVAIFNTYDFRGFLVVYIFDKIRLYNDISEQYITQYNTAVYYKDQLVLANNYSDFSDTIYKSFNKKDTICYTKDNYTIVTKILANIPNSFYQSFTKQMIAFAVFLLIFGMMIVIASEKFINKKIKTYTNTLLSHSRQHHYTAIKSTIQNAVRNQYIQKEEQTFLNEYFEKISFVELHCLYIQLDNINSLLLTNSYKDIILSMKRIMHIFENVFSKFGTCIIIDLDFDTIGLILASKQILGEEELTDSIRTAREEIEKLLSVTVTISAIESIMSSNDLLYSFIRLKRLSEYRFFVGYNSTILESIETDNTSAYPIHLQNKITSSLISRNNEEFLYNLHEFFDEVRKTNFTIAKQWMLELAFALSKCSSLSESIVDIISELLQADTLENQLKIFESCFMSAHTPQDDSSISTNIFIEQTNNIIENEYTNIDFNLGMYADILNISVDYAGRKFKKLFQKNFNTYIAEYRIAKAVELLKSNDIKTAELAQMCGFSSAGYFIKIFKKVTSMTPTEYKNKIINDVDA